MELAQILKLLPKKNWLTGLGDLSIVLSDGEKKSIAKEILMRADTALKNRKHGLFIDWMVLGTFLNREYFLPKAKQCGYLRHSTFIDGSKNPIFTLTDHFIDHAALFNFSDAEIAYFESLRNLKTFFQEIRNSYRWMINQIVAIDGREKRAKGLARRSAVKALLAFNELNFLTNRTRTPNHDLDDVSHYTNEEISESVSLIISKWEALAGLDGYDLFPPDFLFFKSSQLEDLVLSGCQFLLLKEIEIYLEKFSFSVAKIDGCFELRSGSEEIGRSMDMAMIMAKEQRVSDHIGTRERYREAVSLDQLNEVFHATFNEAFTLVEIPFKRYAFNMPVPVLELIKSIDGPLYREDIMLMESVEKELLLPFEEFKQLQVREDLTFHDLIALFRVFFVMDHFMASKLINKINDEEETVFNSLCPVFREDKMLSFLSDLYPRVTVHDFLDCFTWDPDSDEYLDLQYSPFIFLDGYYCLSPAVLTRSRITRNIFRTESKKGNLLMDQKNRSYDKLIRTATHELTEAGFEVKTNLPVKFITVERTESDVDILATRGSLTLIIECKDSLATAGIFELRTIFDHLLNGSSQLRFLTQAFTDREFVNTFGKKHGVIWAPDQIFVPMILTSNRDFWGSNFETFAVRNVHEFSNFLSTGRIRLRMPDGPEEVFNLWVGERCTNEDIVRFLSNDGKPHNAFFDSMADYHLDYKGIFKIKRYALALDVVREKLIERYKIV